MKKLLRIRITDNQDDIRLFTVEVDVPEGVNRVVFSDVDLLDIPTEEEEKAMNDTINEYRYIVNNVCDEDGDCEEAEDEIRRRVEMDVMSKVSPMLYADMLLGGDEERSNCYSDITDKLDKKQYKHWCEEWLKAADEYDALVKSMKNYITDEGMDTHDALAYMAEDVVRHDAEYYCRDYVKKYDVDIWNDYKYIEADSIHFTFYENLLSRRGIEIYKETVTTSYNKSKLTKFKFIDSTSTLEALENYRMYKDSDIHNNSGMLVVKLPYSHDRFTIVFTNKNGKGQYNGIYVKCN